MDFLTEFLFNPILLQASGTEQLRSPDTREFFDKAVNFALLSFLFFILGLIGSWLLFGKGSRRLRLAREENLRMTTQLGDMVEDQSVLISSLQNKYGVEQKRWSLQMANRDSKLEELTNRLSQFDENSPTVQANLDAKEDQIRRLNLQIQERSREIERLKQGSQNDTALTGRVTQLENLLKQRDQEIRNVRAEQKAQNDEWTRLLQLKEDELEALRNQQQEVVHVEDNSRLLELEGLIQQRDVELGQLRAELTNSQQRDGEAGQLRAELEQLRGEMSQQERDINELLSGRDDELNRLRAERANYDGMDSKLRELEQVIHNKNSEIDSLKNAQRGRVEELEDMLGERESMIVALQGDLAAKEGLREQHGRIRDLEDQIMRLKRELADRTDLRGELQHLQNELRGRDSEFEGLRNQLETSRRDRDARIQELNDMLRDRDDELNRLRGEMGNKEEFEKRLSDLEWQLGEKNGELEGRGKRIEELEYLLWEKNEQFDAIQNEKQGNVQELEWKLGEKDTELAGVRQEKDSLTTKIRDLEWLLGEKDGELEFLRHEKNELDSKATISEGLNSRVEDLERSLREREGEVERWFNENEALKNQIRNRDTELETLRRSATSVDSYRTRIEELEWLLGERDGELEKLRLNELELERLRSERSSSDDFQFRLRDMERLLLQRENEISSLKTEVEHFSREARISRPDPTLDARVRDLELQLLERDRELNRLRAAAATPPLRPVESGVSKLSSIEKASTQDLDSRIRELERLLDQGKNTSRSGFRSLSPVGDSEEFRLTLEDGTVVYVKGDEQIEYEGRMRTASELFNSIEDERRGSY